MILWGRLFLKELLKWMYEVREVIELLQISCQKWIVHIRLVQSWKPKIWNKRHTPGKLRIRFFRHFKKGGNLARKTVCIIHIYMIFTIFKVFKFKIPGKRFKFKDKIWRTWLIGWEAVTGPHLLSRFHFIKHFVRGQKYIRQICVWKFWRRLFDYRVS